MFCRDSLGAMTDAIYSVPKPKGYKPPTYQKVEELLKELKKERQPALNRAWAMKKARRGDWKHIVARIPAAYRSFVPDPDLPVVRDMIQRIVGTITRQEPVFQVTPASSRPPAVNAAAKEEARLHALRLTIQDQQDRDVYAMGIDAQVAFGESWIGTWPDPTRMGDKGYEREAGEGPGEYSERYEKLMAHGGVPIALVDFDMQTVFPKFSRERLALVIIETEHTLTDIDLGLGYTPVKDEHGKVTAWKRMTLGEGQVANRNETPSGAVMAESGKDMGQAENPSGSNPDGSPSKVKKVIYCDQWVCETFIDGILAERWPHEWGYVPLFPAFSLETSDRDPAWQSAGIADGVLKVAEQLVLQAAIMTAAAMRYGFPTAFLKNPQQGLTTPWGNEPRIRRVELGQLNLLGPNEEIQFPYSNANLSPDFYKNLEWLQGQMEGSTPSNFGKAIGTDVSGYAIAQVRNTQMSTLAPVYRNAARQWRKIGYCWRHQIRTEFPGGLFMRGAVEETDDGTAFQPVLRYGAEHCTDNAINVAIAEGIPQDEMAKQKMAIELNQAGIWSVRRAMEETGVEDPAAEDQEIRETTLRRSPAYAQQLLTLANAMNATRLGVAESTANDPLTQLLVQSRQEVLKARPGAQPNPAGGQPANPGAMPDNALPGGQPIQQNMPPATPLEGGPTAGAQPGQGMDLKSMAVPQMPGGPKMRDTVPA